MTSIAYLRVSTKDQSLDLQRDAMAKAGIEKFFEDEGVSGAKTSRPALDAAISYMREGDELVVWRLDRLGRSTIHVLTLIDELAAKGIAFRSLTEGIDTSTIQGKLMLQILAALSEMEKSVLQERTSRGLDAARARGRVGGRKPSLTYANKQQLMKLYRSQTMTINEIAGVFSVSEPTVYRAIAEMKKNKK